MCLVAPERKKAAHGSPSLLSGGLLRQNQAGSALRDGGDVTVEAGADLGNMGNVVAAALDDYGAGIVGVCLHHAGTIQGTHTCDAGRAVLAAIELLDRSGASGAELIYVCSYVAAVISTNMAIVAVELRPSSRLMAPSLPSPAGPARALSG